MGQLPHVSQWNQRTEKILLFCHTRTQHRAYGHRMAIRMAISGCLRPFQLSSLSFLRRDHLGLDRERSCAAESTGLCCTFVLAGSVPRKLSSFQFVEGLIGRGTNPPPQYRQTFPRTCSTHEAQKVRSYEQMRTSSDSDSSAPLQCSQVSLSSSMVSTMGATYIEQSMVQGTFSGSQGYVRCYRDHSFVFSAVARSECQSCNS